MSELAPATERIPVHHAKRTLVQVFSALTSRGFRIYATSVILSSTGTWVTRISLDWLVLELTHSVALVGVTTAVLFGPTIIFGLWAGVLSDRYHRRRLIIVAQASTAAAAVTLGLLVVLDQIQVAHVLSIAAIMGLATALESPTRSALLGDMVGTGNLSNAVGITASAFHLGGVIGPAIAGGAIALVGTGWSAFGGGLVIASSLIGLALIPSQDVRASPRIPFGNGQILEALKYAARKPTILRPLLMLTFVAVFGMNLPVLLASAAETSGSGAGGYGLYAALAALGALFGALSSSTRLQPRLKWMLVAAGIYGGFTAVAGVMPWQPAFLVSLVAIGWTRLTFATAAESLTQLSTNRSIRGRVMSLYMLVLVGGQALGGVLVGFITDVWGTLSGFLVAGAGPAAAAVTIAVLAITRRSPGELSPNA